MSLIENFEALLARGQDNALLRFSLGGEYLKLKECRSAIEHLRKALEFDAKYSAAWKLLGKALVANGDTQEAIQVYENGIKVAEGKGDKQAVKEMQVFLKRLQK